MNFRTDDELFTAYGLEGDVAAFELLYRRYRHSLFGYIRQQLPEAAANQLFLACWQQALGQAADYQANGSFRAYLFRLCRRQMAEFWRQQELHGATPELWADEEPEPVPWRKDAQSIWICLSHLPQQQQEVFKLKQTGLTMDEIGPLLQLSFETMKGHLHGCYQNLQRCWERHDDREDHH